MWWKLAAVYLLAIPVVVCCIYRAGQVLSAPRRSLEGRDLLERRRH